MLKELIQKNQEINMQIAQLKVELVEHSKKLLKEATAVYFSKYNTFIESISWEQFTPYYNDGEACEFRVNEPVLRWKAENPEDDDNDYSEDSIYAVNINNLDTSDLEYELRELQEYLADPIAWSKAKLAKDRLKYNYYRDTPDDYYVTYPPSSHTVQSIAGIINKINSLPADFKQDTKDILELITSIPEDTMKEAFGDHIKIIIMQDQVIAEGYDHE